MDTTQTEVGNEVRQYPVTDAVAPASQSFANNSAVDSVDQAQMVSGFGQYHTNEYDPDKPNKKLKPYVTVSWPEIVAMAKNPQEVAKANAQWFIPSTLASRTFKEQEAHGQYWVLPFDFDQNTELDLDSIVSLFDSLINQDIELLAYHSSSATPEELKCRVLIPLAIGVTFQVYKAVLTLLNDKLEARGLIPDRALERAGQVVYLPNKGEHYDSALCGNSNLFFNPHITMAKELDDYFRAETAEIEAARIEREARQEQARIKRNSIAWGQYSRPIDAFKATYAVDEMLLKYGYDFDGKHNYRHPNSASGSFSASVKDGRVYSLSTNDPLHTADSSNGAHDAFSVFCTLGHGGNQVAATKDACDNWLLINGEPWNKVSQREYMEEKHIIPTVNGELFSLAQFTLNGSSEKMREKMLEDKFILGRLAILGQITQFYAPPNAGKTLLTIWLLRQAIEAGDINAEDVFYINADDNYKGLVEKIAIAEALGFHMLAPSHNGFDPDKFSDYLKRMVDEDTARGKIAILDTSKKFIDVMSKDKQSEFGKRLRQFALHGGSVIMLGHTNKHRGADGKLIPGGTTDLVDDADCVYILDYNKKPSTGENTVVFENIKSRGDVDQTASYIYERANGRGYSGLLASVRPATADETNDARRATAIETLLQKNHELIHAILETMQSGISLKTEVIKDAAERAIASKTSIKRVLAQHTGEDYMAGHRWSLTIGGSNAHIYRPVSLLPTNKEAIRKLYEEVSNGS
jgi:hypothetical protein